MFYWHEIKLQSHVYHLSVSVCSRTEGAADKLWIPESSPYITNKEWLDGNFQNNQRSHIALYEAQKGTQNVLTPEALMQVLLNASPLIINDQGYHLCLCIFSRCSNFIRESNLSESKTWSGPTSASGELKRTNNNAMHKKGQLGSAAYQLGNTSLHTITEVKQH